MLEALEELSWGTGDPEGWAKLSTALLEAFAACDDSEQLIAVMGCGGIAELTYLEGGYEPAHIEAGFARARTWTSAQDIAAAIGLAVRATAFDPGALLVRDGIARGDKEHLFDVLDAHAEQLREGLGAAAPIRAASAHALARCRSVTADDAAKMLELAATETDDEALATLLLASAAIAVRLPAVAGSASAYAPLLEHRSPLVRCCAAAALAHFVESIDPRTTQVLAEAITHSAALPAGWGWRWQEHVETTRAIAVRVLCWARCDEPSVAIAALAALDGETMLEADALFHQAFPDDSVCELGCSVDELDDDQRVALGAFAKPGFGAHTALVRKLGLHIASDVAALLAGEGALWTVRDVETEAGPRRWNMVRIWREHVAGQLDISEATRAISSVLPPSDVVEAVCMLRHGPLLAAHATGSEQAERDQLLTRAVFEQLRRSGFDLVEQCRRMLAGGGRYHSVSWAIALLEAFDGTPPPEAHDAIAAGIRSARADEPFAALVTQLSEADRKAVLAKASPR